MSLARSLGGSTRRRGLIVASVAFAVAMAGFAGSAEARGKNKRKKKRAKITAAQKKEIGALAGAFKFGMSKDQVLKTIDKQLKERYDELIEATEDVYVQDKLRKKRNRELKRVRKSWTAFKGKRTGWDVSIVDDQFRHGTDEAMMVLWETHQGRNQRRFFFFHRGQLYKMFIALNTSVISGNKTFSYFGSLMIKKFGKATAANGRLVWNTTKFHVEAVNKLRFYQAFCLAISDQARMRGVSQERAANAPPAKKPNNIIEAVKSDGDDDPDLSDRSNTIDSLIKGN